MTRLQNLNAYLTERLMVAAREILEVVGNTISEYQKETARTIKENEELRRRLREIGVQANLEFLDDAHHVAPLVSIGAAPQGQQPHEQQCNSGLEEEREPQQTDIKQEFPEQHESKPEQGVVDLNKQASALTCTENPSELRILQTSLPFEENNEEVGCLPHMLPDQIKSEPDELDYSIQKQSIASQPLNRVNNNSNTAESKNCAERNWMDHGGVMPEPNDQDSSREVSIVSCLRCGRTFSKLSDLKLHLLVHESERQYTCATCGESFKKQAQLKLHEGTHSGKEKNCCSVCGKSFAYLGKLKAHLRIHTGEKPFGCTVCGKRFTQSGHMKEHLRVHTGEKPFGCPYCGKRFIQSSQFKRHLAIHTR
uniref:Zinc finger protein 891-like n=1 Tax=Paramormyrops kingsleyae TaxID=1676925 RepID=A0A3B3RRH7_9TELE|nr:zinc finger protein 891-like isoform X1 [Paramormyrops kingsleyae]